LPAFTEVTKMRWSLLLASVMFAAACAAMAQSVPPAQTQQPPVQLSPAMPVAPNTPDPAKLAEPAGTKPAAGAPVDLASFVLGAEDQISVGMWDEPKFNGSYVIRPDGKIALPLIGEIQAAGLTPLQLQDAINKAALSQLKTPRSFVNVLAVHSKHVYFDGEGIGQPGAMDLVIPIHLLEAISARGGFKDFASKNKITILRGGKKLLVDHGGRKTEYFKYSDMVSGKHPESNPLLLDGDHVIVP